MRAIPFLLFVLLASTAAAEDPIQVGVIIPLSGPYGLYGEAARVGFELGLEDAKVNSLVTPIFEDDRYGAVGAISAYKLLTESKKVDLVAALGTPGALAIAPLSEHTKIPLFVWTASQKAVRNRPWAIRVMPSGLVQGSAAAREATRRGHKRVAFVNAINEFSQANADGFISTFAGTVAVREEFDAENLDFRSFLTKASKLGVDAIGLCLNVPQLSVFARQARQLQFRGELFGCNTLSSHEAVRAAPRELEGTWFIEGRVTPEFLQKFGARVTDTGAVWVGAAFYDIARLVANAVKQPERPLRSEHFPNTCLERGALASNCIREADGERFFEIALGVTEIRGGNFLRHEQTP